MSIHKMSRKGPKSEINQSFPNGRWSQDSRPANRAGNVSSSWRASGNFWLEIPILHIRLAIVGVGLILTVLAGMYAPWLAEVINRLFS